jgi:hypothetical protein
MKASKSFAILFALPLLVATLTARGDDKPQRNFRADLRGSNEVPLTLSGGHGTLQLTVRDDDLSVHFVLTWQGLDPAVPILFSHIHIGQPNVNGGVTVFFCGGGPTGHVRPACDQGGSGTVEGDFTEADVIGLTTQQLEVNNLAKVLQAIRAGETYANLHTMSSPGGEIRGQIKGGKGDN